mmetsp:Transcript_26302/g.62407  ORF Transcript_26302/g.62407 Transcript_26302/m.62407 type:complete len:149 (-) Transcript_26302:1387-1833(-)
MVAASLDVTELHPPRVESWWRRKHEPCSRPSELSLTWFISEPCPTLLLMQKRPIQRGRPSGTTTYEAEPAIAFGAAVRHERTSQGIAQETLAHMAGIERSHMGKIERGEHVPTLPLILKIARALKCSSAHLMALTEAKLAEPASKSED